MIFFHMPCLDRPIWALSRLVLADAFGGIVLYSPIPLFKTILFSLSWVSKTVSIFHAASWPSLAGQKLFSRSRTGVQFLIITLHPQSQNSKHWFTTSFLQPLP